MPLSHILILGAGPSGLSTALAISQSLPSVRITILELRSSSPASAALGGAVNLTPLALRYLDRLGVGQRVRQIGIPVGSVDQIALRTGRLLGKMWRGVDAVRIMRAELVGVMRDEVAEREGVEVRYGVRVVRIREEEEGGNGGDGVGKVVIELEGGEEERGDILLGCDGLHSVVRRLYVEPERRETFTGRVVAYGFAKVKEPGEAGLVRGDGRPAVEDTAMFVGRYGAMVMSFFEESRERLFVGGVMGMKNEGAGVEGGDRDGWKTKGSDKEYVKAEVRKRFGQSRVAGYGELLDRVDEWTLYPVYLLPAGGRWAKGRVLLLGDASHTMPPMGESIGIAIEDGSLIARVLTRHRERTVDQLFADYETLRRPAIDKVYKATVFRWNLAAREDLGWFRGILMEYMTIVFLWYLGWKQNDYFSTDVAKLQLPS